MDDPAKADIHLLILTPLAARAVTFQNIFYNSAASESGAKRRGPGGPNMKSQRGMGGVVSDVRFRNVTGGTADGAASITMCHHDWKVGTLPTPTWANISFEGASDVP